MDSYQLQKLLREPEGLKLDFKREMYKLNSDSPEARKRESNEMIKDLLAIANGNASVAGETGYLIIGAGDKLKLDRSRDLYDVGVVNFTSQSLLERVNTVSSPPLPDLQAENILCENTRLFVFIIPPSPYLHETSRKLEAKKASYNEGTVFIRRSEGIYPALNTERDTIIKSKQLLFQETSSTERSDEETKYDIERIRFEEKIYQLKGIHKARALFSRAELLTLRIKKLRNGEIDKAYINQLYTDVKAYLESALKEKSLSTDNKARSYWMLAKIYYEFEDDQFTAYDFCCRSIQKREDYIEAYKIRIRIGRDLVEDEDNSYRERAVANLVLDEEKLQSLLTRKASQS